MRTKLITLGLIVATHFLSAQGDSTKINELAVQENLIAIDIREQELIVFYASIKAMTSEQQRVAMEEFRAKNPPRMNIVELTPEEKEVKYLEFLDNIIESIPAKIEMLRSRKIDEFSVGKSGKIELLGLNESLIEEKNFELSDDLKIEQMQLSVEWAKMQKSLMGKSDEEKFLRVQSWQNSIDGIRMKEIFDIQGEKMQEKKIAFLEQALSESKSKKLGAEHILQIEKSIAFIQFQKNFNSMSVSEKELFYETQRVQINEQSNEKSLTK